MLRAVKKRRVYEDIVGQINHLIQRGKLKRGDQLPTERELVDTFKVSRASVREAIFYLEAINLVQRRQGDGTYVIASNEEAIVQPLATSLFHEKDDLIDIFSLRKIIEPEVAQLASENATDEEIAELKEILEEQKREVVYDKNPIRTDSDFHHCLARIARNRVLERLLLALFDLLRQTRERYLQPEERKRRSLQGHQKIFSAIKRRNPVATRKAMRQHLEDVEDIIFKKRKEVGKSHRHR
ncbi:MAG TPA: FadR/GntR family transcriptional regulator [Thermodesulfobacteriota bacterium]|nr:FadR/GntR family transcriptional regulator [Thermodesulfobacteriota bacterium]